MERINVRVDGRLKKELEAEAREKGVRPRKSCGRCWKSTCGSGLLAQIASISPSGIGILGSTKTCPPT